MVTFCIDYGTLLVHHIIILQQTLPYTKVVFLHFLLRTLNALGNHRMLDDLTFLISGKVHHLGNTLATKHTHQVILEANEEHGRTRISLPTGTTTQLPIHTAALVTLGTHNCQTTRFFHPWP